MSIAIKEPLVLKYVFCYPLVSTGGSGMDNEEEAESEMKHR